MEQAANTMELIAATIFIVVGIIAAFRGFTRRIEKNVDRQVAQVIGDIKTIQENFINNNGSSMRDVIDRIELSLKQINGQTNFMFDHTGVSYIETDGKGMLTYSNKAHLQLVGMTLDELRGNGWVNSIYPEDRDFVFNEFHLAVRQERDLLIDFRYSKGQKVHAHCTPIKDNKGKVQKWICLVMKK